MGWWAQLWHSGAQGHRLAAAHAHRPAPEPPVSIPLDGTRAHADDGPLPAPLLPWLLDQPPPASGDVSTLPELRALARIDALIAKPVAPADWLPRARSVIPQLLAMLRREDIGSEAVAQQVGRDAALTAEVLRLACVASAGGARDRPASLRQALDRIGRTGLNCAVSHVVLQPMFSPVGHGLAARAGARLWLHAQSKATHGGALAQEHGIDPFEGYLAGLLHNCGVTIALHEIDRRGPIAAASVQHPAPAGFTAAFSEALAARCDVLFGLAAAAWQITPMLSAVAHECVARTGLRGSPLPLAQLLCRADALATGQLAGAA